MATGFECAFQNKIKQQRIAQADLFQMFPNVRFQPVFFDERVDRKQWKHAGQWVQGITPRMMRKISWINPVFVCQVKFAEWTRDAKLRAPVYLGLRTDKAPAAVKREMPA